MIVPPSLHASGRRYEWRRQPDETPLAPMPDWLLGLLLPPITSSPAPDTPERLFVEGTRNDRLFRLACSMRHYGVINDAIAAALLAINQTQCYPPLSEVEVQRIAQSAMRYAPGSNGQKTHVWPCRTVEAREVFPWRA